MGSEAVSPVPSDVGHPLGKLSGIHDWLALENRRVKQWWATRSGTEMHRIYLSQLHDTDELRSQLNEQLRALDGRLDTQTSILAELQDWFRRRAELHQDYSSKLDKFSKSLHARHKEQKLKREPWALFSVYNCWQLLLNQTRKDARDHAAMADVYVNNIIPRFTEVQDDVQRIYKKCREIGYESHEELLKVLHELHTTMRTYHTYQTDFKSSEAKLQNIEGQKAKMEKSIPKEKLEKSKKYRVLGKEIQKRNIKFQDAKLKAMKARNEYILSMDSANAAIHKYFVEDLSDIIDCMDFGFHSSMARALMTHIGAQECLKRTLQNGIDDMNKSINNLDSRHDKQRFLEFNNAAFMLPKKFEFQGHKGDEINQVVINRTIQEEIEQRYSHLSSRLTNLKTESEETWKTIETAEKTLMEMINKRDYDIAHYFADEPRVDIKEPESMVLKKKADRQETEAFYLGKFREYTLASNLICRLEARFELLRKASGNELLTSSSPTPSKHIASKARRRRIGRTPLMGQPRLFGGSLEEYLEATSQEIPLIMKSCIRVINLFGLHHQGIFRVSGSQLEINNFRESFERMEDPLADVIDASDINSVAGVLKLYLRELREPIFPTVYFEQFMEIAQLESKQDFVTKVREVATTLPRPVFVVMRYLFAFLNHLSEFSDENMMDPYNLAICFGPTLVPIPDDKDQVQYQNLVNDLIKNIIIFSEDIFPNDGGTVYEKYITRDSLDLEADIGYAPTDDPDSMELDFPQSEDESEILEAVAQFDFTARSERELTFSKGDFLILQSQVSSDWWRGTHKGKTGLIPDKYILIKIRDEEKDREKFLSEGDTKRRTSSSSESQVTPSHMSTDAFKKSFNCATATNNANLIQDKSLPSSHEINSSSPGSSLSSNLTLDKEYQSSSLPPTLTHPKEEVKIGRSSSFNRALSSSSAYLTPLDKKSETGSRTRLNEFARLSSSFSETSDRSFPETPHPVTSDRLSGLEVVNPNWNLVFSPKSGDELSPRSSSGAPDLVMDLPLNSLSSSPKDGSSLCEAVKTDKPEIRMTAAECFAKQDQSTLKKTPVKPNNSDAQTQTAYKVVEPEDVFAKSLSCDEPVIEIRSASELVPPINTATPSTPKLAERYLQAVVQSGGGNGIAVKPQVRIKPTVMKKPSLPQTSFEQDKD